MKRTLIIALVCVNLALLAALMLGAATPKAQAQVIGGGTDYLMITSQTSSNLDLVYIIDLGRRRLRCWKWNKSRDRLEPYRSRALLSDFRRAEEPGR